MRRAIAASAFLACVAGAFFLSRQLNLTKSDAGKEEGRNKAAWSPRLPPTPLPTASVGLRTDFVEGLSRLWHLTDKRYFISKSYKI